jgi:hypothetical protein
MVNPLFFVLLAKVGLQPATISVLENVGTIEVTVFRVGNSIGTNKVQ